MISSSDTKWRLFTVVVLVFYTTSIIYTSVWIAHNAREDHGPNIDVEEVDISETKLGLTFGDFDKGFIGQSSSFIIILFILSSILVGLFEFTRLWKNDVAPFVMTGGYFFLIMGVFLYHPKIRFFNEDGETISTYSAIFGGEVIHWFWFMIIAHIVMIGSVSLFWSIPMVPKEYIKPPKDTDALTLHLENWRKYGSWTLSLLTGLALSASLIIVLDSLPFGSAFSIHIVIVFGGGLVLNMIYMGLKLRKIEQAITSVHQNIR